MKRLTQIARAILIVGLLLLLKGNPSLVTAQTPSKAKGQTEEAKSTRDAPPDTWHYTRPAVPDDSAPRGIKAIPLFPGIFIVDDSIQWKLGHQRPAMALDGQREHLDEGIHDSEPASQ
jgi:hypothetical protein